MPRKPRIDAPFLLHHVCNRGIASRPVFEDNRDITFFLERVGRAAEKEGVDVLAYSLLTTHFHLLVRTTQGSISRAVRAVEQPYVLYFNRTRGRDGPLFKDRFFSRPIRSDTDFRLVVRYIDENPVVAGLATRSIDYAHGSARWYAQRGGPPWLARATIENAVCGGMPYDPTRYLGAFGTRLTTGQRALLERRMLRGRRGPDLLDELIEAAPQQVRAWLEARAQLADGGQLRDVLVPADGILNHPEANCGDWCVRFGRLRRPAGPVAVAAILRLVSGLTYAEISVSMAISLSAVVRLLHVHRRALREDPRYAERVSSMLHGILQKEFGSSITRSLRQRAADASEPAATGSPSRVVDR